ncbi:SDR family NAD(P)-dependent oxidoreductase [Methylocaldum sp.]|uniref:SDR family NAD(P)-dependent oxidoreductase n=1 Tax=Methylocaldum sp. TaxID=1969727 RepID=UPI002D2F62C7|nr:SDR family NAD(P)-dependent oxidoreductase [Methylocaldum sp.]HYE36425.1 SDR family NAD(P)-dependent oxidoreductase [Methylocaldum sp.]
MADTRINPASEDKLVALVTGTSSGIGRATAPALREAGFLTVATARRLADIEELKAKGCETAQLDVTDETSMREAVKTAEDRYGPVYVLVNNAGYGQYGPLEEVPMDAVRRQFEVNVFGLVRMCQLVLPGMRQAGRGRVINVSSVAGEISQPGAGFYHATKHAVEAINETLRLEASAFGIDVVDIQPGPVATNFAEVAVSTIPDTGADSPYRVFKQNLAETTREMLKFGRTGVLTAQEVAEVIVEAATASKPDTRYHVGAPSKLMSVLHGLMPDRVWDAAVSRMVPFERK